MTNLPEEDSSGMPDAARVNLDALANMANVPARFHHLVAGIEAWRSAALEQERDESRKRDRDFADMAAEMAQIRQQEIDSNRLKLNIGGEDVDISQGDLRRAMEQRRSELREQRDELMRNGGNREQINSLDRLIDQYDPLIESTGDEKADANTLEAIEELSKQDPGLKKWVDRERSPGVQIGVSRSTSFAADHFNDGPTPGISLKDAFSKSSAPAGQSEPAPSAPASNPTERKLDANLGAMGF